ncbi:MAG: phage holin family protein [Cyanobacteria bacterium P01_E01_bin.42]
MHSALFCRSREKRARIAIVKRFQLGEKEIMNGVISFLITALVTAVSLLIISRLPLGIEVDSTKKAIWAGVVFGLLNGLVKPIVDFLTFPINFLTLGLVGFIVNVCIFGLAAKLVEGFRLNWSWASAVLGAIALGFVNSVLYSILFRVFPTLG